MSTPAAAALNDASANNSTPATPAATPPAAVPGNPPAAASPAANAGQFWNSWDKPDQKDTRDWVANKNYADPFVLAKTAQGLEREAATLRQAKGYPVDKAGADGKTVRDENAWKAWAAATGVPEKADAYDIHVPENNPYPEFKGYMAEAMHKAGVPAAMAPALVKGYEEAVGKMEAAFKAQENAASERGMVELKESWGANYQERMSLAQRGQQWLSKEVGGLNDMQMRTMESVMGTSKFLAAMWKIGAGNGEARFAGGDNPGQFKGGASEAQARLDTIQSQRAAGTISNFQWRELSKSGGEIEQLTNQIVSGMAPQQ